MEERQPLLVSSVEETCDHHPSDDDPPPSHRALESLSRQELFAQYKPSFRFAMHVFTATLASVWSSHTIPGWILRWLARYPMVVLFFLLRSQARAVVRDGLGRITIGSMRPGWDVDALPLVNGIFNFLLVRKASHAEELYIPNDASEPIRAILIRHQGRDPINHSRGVILHIHGGGFVSMRPEDHLKYLHHWAQRIQGVTILSIDYRLAPEHPFPCGLQDCYKAYQWVLHHYSTISPHHNDEEEPRVILAGDSAGGNLVAAVALKAIDDGIKPSAAIFGYPWMEVCPEVIGKTMSPTHSRRTCVNDPLIPYEVLELCRKSYLNHIDFNQSPPVVQEDIDIPHWMHSPLHAPKRLWSSFPPSFIHVGCQDPFHTEAIDLYTLLIESGCDAEIKQFEGVGHGYLNMAEIVSEGSTASHMSCDFASRHL